MRTRLACLAWVVLSGMAAAQPDVDCDLWLQVVDTSGTVQSGVPLRLVLRSAGMIERSDVVLWLGETDEASGVARVPGPALAIDRACWGDLAVAGDLVVEIPIRSCRTFHRTLGVEQVLSGMPVRLVIPRTGRVLASVVDRRSRPVPEATVRLFGAHVLGVGRDDWQLLGERTTDESGSVRFDHVEVGLEVLLFAQGVDGRWQPAETSGPSPYVAGGEASFWLHFRDPNTYFRTRLVGPDGAPLGDTKVFVDQRVDGTSVVDTAGFMPGAPQRTDADGGLTVKLDRALGTAASFELVFSLPDPHDVPKYAVPVRQAGLELIDRVERGRVHLGELRLDELPVVAAGRVAAVDGGPIRGAVVTVYEAIAGVGPSLGRLGLHPVPCPGRPGSRLEPRFRSRTRKDGAFEIHGDAGPGEWFVAVHHRLRALIAPVPFAPGDRGLGFVDLGGSPPDATDTGHGRPAD